VAQGHAFIFYPGKHHPVPGCAQKDSENREEEHRCQDHIDYSSGFNGEFVVRPTDSFNETEMFLDSFGVEEIIGDISDVIESITGTSANPNGIVDEIKNKIIIRDKTDFN